MSYIIAFVQFSEPGNVYPVARPKDSKTAAEMIENFICCAFKKLKVIAFQEIFHYNQLQRVLLIFTIIPPYKPMVYPNLILGNHMLEIQAGHPLHVFMPCSWSGLAPPGSALV